jgi:hypothetical protein
VSPGSNLSGQFKLSPAPLSFEVKLRSLEGLSGVLNLFVFPVEGRSCQQLTWEVKALSLHQLAQQVEQRECSELRVQG